MTPYAACCRDSLSPTSLVVAVKFVIGARIRSLAVVGDAIHSSVDSLNNVIGLAVMRVVAKGPDDDHPYGHAKFESLGALLIVVFLSVTLFELLKGAVGRLTQPAAALRIDTGAGRAAGAHPG